MQNDEWQPAGAIVYSYVNQVPVVKIITSGHIYEMQACRLAPILEKFSLRVDGKFHSVRYDSFDRVMRILDASESGFCNEIVKRLTEENLRLRDELQSMKDENDILVKERDDMKVMLYGR